jgi:crotonobetainyl-CoA:carnitine CoA-transferase CaiB-like acyl-CoA transferase
MNAHALLGYTMNGCVRERDANRHTVWAPHGAYPCAGTDQWVAVTVQDDAQFQALCEAMGRPALAKDPRFADALSRWEHEADLREPIASWTRTLEPRQAMDLLQARGVPAGAANTAANLPSDPQIVARDFIQWIDRPVNGGKGPYYGYPAVMSRTPLKARKATPTVGEDNEFIFGEVLHLSRRELDDLKGRGIISTEVKIG